MDGEPVLVLQPPESLEETASCATSIAARRCVTLPVRARMEFRLRTALAGASGQMAFS